MSDLVTNLERTAFADLFIYHGKQFIDDRGAFRKFLDRSLIPSIKEPPKECYVSTSSKNAVRGLHFQKPPYAQYKIVTCLTGSFLDVAVDLRPESATYGKTFTVEISQANNKVVFVPPLFAHGIISLEDNTTMLSLSSVGYYPESEDGIKVDSLGLELDFSQLNFTVKDTNSQSLAHYVAQNGK